MQRCIVVDEDIRKKWESSFETHETSCEKLGALHLLQHGVWAFKANATGGRADLILNEPLNSTSLIEKTADAFVLTEWKLVKSEANLEEKIKEAKKQTEIYKADVLGELEIRSYRYLIMVSKKRLAVPNDILDRGTIYRHINIAVNSLLPSVEALR